MHNHNMTPERITQIEESAAHWNELANEADRMAEWEVSFGRHPGAYPHKAHSYRSVVVSMIMEIETGEPHCSCCIKPMSHHHRK